MKKFFVLLCVLVLFAGIAAAEDIGVTLGAELYVYNVNKADGDEMSPTLTPSIAYDKSLLDGDLDFHTDLGYNFDFVKEDDVNPQSLDFNITLTYYLSLGSASTLTLELANDNTFTIAPRSDEGNNFDGTLTPRVRFTQKTNIGSIYAQAAAPIGYIDDDKEADKTVNLRSRLGWNSTFGLGLWAQVYSKLVPDVVAYNGLGVNLSYGADSFDFSVFTRLYKELSDGLTITPEFDYYFGNFTFYVYCDFEGVAAEGDGQVIISPAIGVSFSF